MNKLPQVFRFSDKIQLEYYIYGTGDRALLCFHGFGQDYTAFEELSIHLTDYQIISFNLFFHGQSDRANSTKYMSLGEWRNILGLFLTEKKINRFSVLGYSMGGRYVSGTLAGFADRIDHCIYMAPDGVVKRPSYEIATFPIGPAQLFGFFMRNPKPFFIFLDWIEKTRLINPWTLKFSRLQLTDEAQRLRVYKCWITLKKFRLKQKQLAKLINRSDFSTSFIFGKYDIIIPASKHLKFLDKLTDTKVFILDVGHAKLPDESITTIAQKILGQGQP